MHLGVIDTPTLGRHADALASRRPSPQELFQRWDTQQWKIADIELEKDIPRRKQPKQAIPTDTGNRTTGQSKQAIDSLHHTSETPTPRGLTLYPARAP